MIIGIQGIEGSFSEKAALFFSKKHSLKNIQLKYLIDSENVLHAVEEKICDYGIFAIENSTGGIVIESVLALARHRCDIFDMFSILVQQNLLVKPGLSASDIDRIYSHQQALRQCRNYLNTNFPQAKLIEEADTALCAKRLMENQLPDTAAVVANQACAELYHLHLLAKNINDLKNNQTLFIAATFFKGNT